MPERIPAPRMSLDQAILRLIAQHSVPDQATLLRLLDQEGFQLTQGPLSRRLAKLSVQKRDGHYMRVIPRDHPLPPYTLTEAPPNLIVLQTKQAWVSRRESGERLRVSRTGELQGQASLALATEGYERGRRSSLEVSDALKNLNDTRREVNRALHARLASEAALRFVMGDPVLPSPSPAP